MRLAKCALFAQFIVLAAACVLLLAGCGGPSKSEDPFLGDWVARGAPEIQLHVEGGDAGYAIDMTLPPNSPMQLHAFRSRATVYKSTAPQLSDKYVYFRFRDVDTMKMSFTSVLDGSYVSQWFDRQY